MKDITSQIESIEEEIRTTPYHKGTEHHIAFLRARLTKLRRSEEEQIKKLGRRIGFIPKKMGDATVILLGPPSVGKSTLLNKLTNAHARVESWPFTTVKVIPGMMFYQGAQIQIFDLPGILDLASEGIGRGREVLSAARIADLILIVVDVDTVSKVKMVKTELSRAKIFLPCITVVNKSEVKKINGEKDWIFISAKEEQNLEQLKERMWEKLGLIRVFLKPRGKKTDNAPLILKDGQIIRDVVSRVFFEETELKQILIWGPSARFDAQEVSISHRLKDGDTVAFS